MNLSLKEMMKFEGEPAIPQLSLLRESGAHEWQQIGVPTRKNEDWKYTNLTPLFKSPYVVPTQAPEFAQVTSDAQIQKLLRSSDGTMVFVNGIYAAGLSQVNNLGKGVHIESLRTSPIASELLQQFRSEHSDGFSALNQAMVQDGFCLRVGKNAQVSSLLHLIFITDSSHGHLATHPHNFIIVESGAEVSVMESYVSVGDIEHFTNVVTDVYLKANSRLTLATVGNENLASFHVGSHRVLQDSASIFNYFNLNIGSRLARHNLKVTVQGEDCETRMHGLYVANGEQHVDHSTLIDHARPRCQSEQHYKGILDGKAHAVFNGKIIIREGSQKVNSRQLNNNLLLTSQAEVDTKPQLEIYADDVKATHGATVGQLSREEIFYIRSRGIDVNSAAQLVLHGFADEILSEISNPKFIENLRPLVVAKMREMKLPT